VVLAVVGVSVAELVLLLIRNGCAATILGLNLSGLIQCLGLIEIIKGLGLGGLVGSLL
jgi:hypothetical protein